MLLAAAATEMLVQALVDWVFPVPNGIPTISLSVGPHEFLGNSFQISPHMTLWRPDRGSYNGLQGYWIFRPDVRMCWQAYNTRGPLYYCSNAGQARGNPDDWELFVFEAAPNPAQVLIKNIYGAYVNLAAGM